MSSVTSYGYNVVKGGSATLPWTAQETDIVDANMTGPLVLYGNGVYKAVTDGAAYQHLPANTAGAIPLPKAFHFPKKTCWEIR